MTVLLLHFLTQGDRHSLGCTERPLGASTSNAIVRT